MNADNIFLIDTHCHIHDEFELPVNEVITKAHQEGVNQMVCVGTNEKSSKLAIEFANKHAEIFAVIGVHPHDSKDGLSLIDELASSSGRIVGIGEIGLDYYYNHSPRGVQIKALESQIETALKYNLPISFHVRDAFDDFWPIFHNFKGLKGVLHSFTDTIDNLNKGLSEGLYIGVNGISTFTKDESQKEMYKTIPLEALLFETDAPFLTPAPFRGKINEPAYVRLIAEFHAQQRGVSLEDIARQTTHNARTLFRLPR